MELTPIQSTYSQETLLKYIQSQELLGQDLGAIGLIKPVDSMNSQVKKLGTLSYHIVLLDSVQVRSKEMTKMTKTK